MILQGHSISRQETRSQLSIKCNKDNAYIPKVIVGGLLAALTYITAEHHV